MTDFIKHDWGKRKDILISILEDTIPLLDDISYSFHDDYHRKTISLFGYLCFGYILISKENINTVLLLKNKMMYQIHYICRNIFEMVVNLTYISNDKSQREERIKRFLDYQIVQRYNILDTLKLIPEISPEFRNEEKDISIQNDYNQYKSRYKITQTYVNDWSGFGLHKMIEKIPDDKKRKDFFINYYLITKINNQYVHPSIKLIKTMIDKEYEKGDKYGDKDEMEVSLLISIYFSISRIIEIYLEHFQKNRQTILNKFYELETRYQTICSEITM